jgi:hypothetical protein
MYRVELCCPKFHEHAVKGQLAKSGVSDNVGGVKLFSTTLLHALEQERHFALVEEVPLQPRLAS